jgi:RNA polymerase sigma factor (sigma-70 family)
MQPNGSEFPPTQWTVIVESTGPRRDAALTQLYRIYWSPLCAQARRFGICQHEVEDVVQEFFVSLFESGSLRRADREVGRFRSYLIGALRHHLADYHDRCLAQKRGGGVPVVPLENVEAPAAVTDAPVDEREFDADWARALVAEAARRFRALHEGDPLCAQALSDDAMNLSHAAAELKITTAAVKSRVFRLRQRFRKIIREEVLRTVATEDECDTELRYLCAVLDKVDGIKLPGA